MDIILRPVRYYDIFCQRFEKDFTHQNNDFSMDSPHSVLFYMLPCFLCVIFILYSKESQCHILRVGRGRIFGHCFIAWMVIPPTLFHCWCSQLWEQCGTVSQCLDFRGTVLRGPGDIRDKKLYRIKYSRRLVIKEGRSFFPMLKGITLNPFQDLVTSKLWTYPNYRWPSLD